MDAIHFASLGALSTIVYKVAFIPKCWDMEFVHRIRAWAMQFFVDTFGP